MAKRQIIIAFELEDADVLEGMKNSMPLYWQELVKSGVQPEEGQRALVELLQWALYDDDEGPQLAGQFNVLQNITLSEGKDNG